MPSAVEWVEQGDVAFEGGARAEGVRRWRRALEEAEGVATPGPVENAVVAMVHLRLVHVEGNFGPFWHEPRWNRALAECPATEAPCALAHADRALLVPRFAGGDPARVEPLLRPLAHDSAYGPLVARRVARAEHGWPEVAEARTWTAFVLLSYAPLSGLGFGFRVRHPDVGWTGQRLEGTAAVDAAGAWAISLRGTTADTPAWTATLGAGEGPAWRWQGDEAAAHALGTLSASGGGIARGTFVGAGARVEWVDGGAPAFLAGPRAGISASSGGVSARASAEAQGGAYAHLGASTELRGEAPAGPTRIVSRLGIDVAPLASTPWWRQPAAGGLDSLRGLPAGRARAPVLATAQAELRVPVWGPVRAALFVDTALAERAYWTTGGGLRLAVPPGDDSDIRLDLAYTSLGVPGLVVGFGEAF